MSEAIEQRLEITHDERTGQYAAVQFFNHAWDDPSALKNIGTISPDEISDLSGGLFEMDVPVEVNAKLFDYDQIVIIGPVFPHEVVGFSGGNKYLFPGVAGPQVLNFFHWLGAVITTPKIIGHKWTPVLQGRRPRRCNGEDSQARLLHGRRERRHERPVCRASRGGVVRGRRPFLRTPHAHDGQAVPHDPRLCAGDVR